MKNTKKSAKVLRILNSSPGFQAASFVFTQIVFFLILLFDTLFYRLEVSGRHHLHLDRAFLVSNHSMYLDPATVGQAVYPRRTHFAVLEETFSIPILGGMIRLLGAFPLPKGNPMKVLLKPMKTALDTFGFVHFFPEGKLYPFNTDIKPFQEGVFFFSLHFNVPVVPLTIVVKRRRRKKKVVSILPPKVRIVIGEPVYPEAYRAGAGLRRSMHAMAESVRCTMQETINSGLW